MFICHFGFRVTLIFYLQLEAKSNEADAAYKTVFREAEARCVCHYLPIGTTDTFSVRFTVNSSL